MTNTEAIETLRANYPDACFEQLREAVDAAIVALKAQNTSGDTISRQEAIDALERIFDRCEEIEAHLPDGDPDRTGYKMFPDYMTVWKYLRQLPSAERRGRWIEEYSANHFQAKCSACGESTLYGITYDLEGNAYYMNYCPNCGARMMDEVEE